MSDEALGEALFALTALSVRRRHRELSLTAASTLSTLERAGPRRLTDLAVSEEVTQPSMTVLVGQLVGQGLVERRRDAGDARVVLVAITDDGCEKLRTMRRVGAGVFTTLVDKLDPDERAALLAALPTLNRLTKLAAS
ncbi:MarR family transcriptional regulator [Jatrophihabitans sp.]|uniref:MarR family winged helix-turn-helix transcriptional regulator n=1 Tax=Jatrophihabitans sp. TaxID=1932789 RepID=UPI0030C69774|nr:slyA [Jatrophihabitans sp.]